MQIEGMNPEQAAVFEWQYGYCEDFKKSLWEAIKRADEGNLYLLSLGFPVEIRGFHLYTQLSGWWQEVQEIARDHGIL